MCNKKELAKCIVDLIGPFWMNFIYYNMKNKIYGSI